MSAYDRTECTLCGCELDRGNCRWGEFPGVCLDCVPPGVLAHVNARRVPRGRQTLRLPRGMVSIRWCGTCGRELHGRRRVCPECAKVRRCACGQPIARGRRKCDACARAARRKAIRRATRRYRARKAAGVKVKVKVKGGKHEW